MSRIFLAVIGDGTDVYILNIQSKQFWLDKGADINKAPRGTLKRLFPGKNLNKNHSDLRLGEKNVNFGGLLKLRVGDGHSEGIRESAEAKSLLPSSSLSARPHTQSPAKIQRANQQRQPCSAGGQSQRRSSASFLCSRWNNLRLIVPTKTRAPLKSLRALLTHAIIPFCHIAAHNLAHKAPPDA